MMLFLTTVKHPRNAVSYERVLDLLEVSLRSVCNQTTDDFRVIVVCNDMPNLGFSDRRIEFFTVDFPPPAARERVHTGDDAVRLDRGAKIAYGLWKAARLKPDHVMLFDADDFVSNGIAGFVAQHPDVPAWTITHGYEWNDAHPDVLVPVNGWFATECGTSRIIKFSEFSLPKSLPDAPTEKEILESFGENYVKMFLGSHIHTAEFTSEPPRPVPFRAAVYRLDNGENHHVVKGPWASWFYKLLRFRLRRSVRINAELRAEFGLPGKR